MEEKQEKKIKKSKYIASVCIYYNNKKFMPDEEVSGIDEKTMKNLIENKYVKES